MTTQIICNRCGKPMRPVYSDGTGAPTQGFCFCPPPVGWGQYTLAPVDWRDAELATLRADLTEARADVARFEAALDAANRELAQARADVSLYHHANQLHIRRRHRDRRTIRALVVAARAMDRTGGGELEGEYWYPTVRGVLYKMQQAKQSGQQAGE